MLHLQLPGLRYAKFQVSLFLKPYLIHYKSETNTLNQDYTIFFGSSAT